MKVKHWIAAGLCIATGLALFAGDAQATDEESSYRFRLANLRITLSAYIRCESSDEWRRVPVGMSRDISCSEAGRRNEGRRQGNEQSHPQLRARPGDADRVQACQSRGSPHCEYVKGMQILVA